MKILAIDPGNVESAYVIWDGVSISDRGIIQNELVIRALGPGKWITHIAIEMIASYGMPVGREVFETCVWIGRFMERWIEYAGGPETIRIPRKEICVHLCGSARAKDANIRQSLIDRLGAPGTKKEPGVTYGIAKDLWSSLAVAVTVFDRLQVGYYK